MTAGTRRKTPLLWVSTALVLATAAHVAAAGPAISPSPPSPLTPPDSPASEASEPAAFAVLDTTSRRAQPLHKQQPKQKQSHKDDALPHYHPSSHHAPASDASEDKASTRSPANKRYLTGVGAGQASLDRPKNVNRSKASSSSNTSSRERSNGEDAASRPVHAGAGSRPAHLDARKVNKDKIEAEQRTMKEDRVDEASQARTVDESATDVDLTSRGSDQERRRKYNGKGTFYRVGGTGACGWHNDSHQMVAAIARAQYRHGSYCGRRARVCKGERCITVKLVDECPGCHSGSLDLSPAAFRALAPLRIGVIDIAWTLL